MGLLPIVLNCLKLSQIVLNCLRLSAAYGLLSPIAIFKDRYNFRQRGKSWSQVELNQDEIRASEAHSSQFKSSQIKPNLAKSRRLISNQGNQSLFIFPVREGGVEFRGN